MPALHRSERDVWRCISLRALCGMQMRRIRQRKRLRSARLLDCELFSQLAVRRRIPEGGSVVSRSLERQDGVQPAVTDSAMVPASTLSRVDRILFVAIAVLALAGVNVSAVSLQRHYAKSATEFCDFSQQFSCDIVNRSQYSTIQGIPVAGIGVAGYAALFLLATFRRIRAETRTELLVAAVAGLAFALY